MPDTEHNFEIAIVGGGIVGLITALGLLKRNIPVKIYEQSRGFREIGAGIGFTTNARKCMALLNPSIEKAVNAVATHSGENKDKPDDYLRFNDGYTWDEACPDKDDPLLYSLDTGREGFVGCHRAHLLDELVKCIPDETVEFRKHLVSVTDEGKGGKMLLHFQDGTTSSADAVIGCDGIKSKVRQLILGADNPAAYPHSSHKVAYRALIPMDSVVSAIGSFKAFNEQAHTGPRAHMLHFPVAGGTLVNFVAFADDTTDWDNADDTVGHMTSPATREEVAAVFKDWGPTVKNLIGLLPDEITKWAIFDTYDHPAPTFVSGRLCLAGDAAHASTPHHGAGAGMGVEDALALATLLEKGTEILQGLSRPTQEDKSYLLEAMFRAYDTSRSPRGKWLVQSSREACEIYEWNHPDTLRDWKKCLELLHERSHKIWDYDIEGMIHQLEADFADRVHAYSLRQDGTGVPKAVAQ
ncbi:salicylate 1-monooxygenase SalA [Colletotrichum orchidophilum]|uniref:Salicylate 1-monooxygenase SalA n=1 Tax=Colletotrichum orchidophilum TaxID=1209926 RepID=A0A1G4AYK0_9PEZI|nr:salicylate 1-monooxygenase SalA [Colletotrichum orchidophilum]OHE94196.1 salicylate 1-monooxygenase SalA [Colletotrichum orchidophilum]